MELGRILFETFFCTEQHDKTIQKFISLGIFFGVLHTKPCGNPYAMVLISCMGSVTFPLLAPWQRKLDAFKAFPAGIWEKRITIEIWAVAQHQGYAFILGIS